MVYVDGESHYQRSLHAWRKVTGDKAVSLSQLRYRTNPDARLYLVDDRAKVFWTHMFSPRAARVSYFTAASCDKDGLFEIRRRLKDFGCEPEVVHELKVLESQRANLRETDRLIEKPKGVDIALAVAMILDATNRRELYDVCHLYTSDVDFLPVITAVQNLGKDVCVFGYEDGLGPNSAMWHVPRLFTDLTKTLRDECERESPTEGVANG